MRVVRVRPLLPAARTTRFFPCRNAEKRYGKHRLSGWRIFTPPDERGRLLMTAGEDRDQGIRMKQPRMFRGSCFWTRPPPAGEKHAMSDPFPRGVHPCASGPIPTPRDEELDLKTFSDAVHRLNTKRGTFKIHVSFDVLTGIVAHLQLALRHPQNVGHTSKVIRAIVEGIIEVIAGDEPDLATLLRMGFDPSFDRVVSVTPMPEGGA